MLSGIRGSTAILAISSALAAAAAGCASDGSSEPGPTPMAPAENDPAYGLEHLRTWYLIPNELTPGHTELAVGVAAPEGTETVDAYIDDRPGVRLRRGGPGFLDVLDLAGLAPGEHTLLLAADGSDTAFAAHTFKVSHPLYVLLTTDWDDADTGDQALLLQDLLHEEHVDLRITHFVGPYTFTDPSLTAERVELLVDWLKTQRDTYDDEIGLHIHPYCNFVDTTDVPCRVEPSTVYETDESGYTVMCAAYTEEEFTELLLASDALFEANGLGKPTSFRAGGWTADLSTLRALAAAGYVADTSANNWRRMEEWEGVQNGVLYEWNSMQWETIDDTSQPYFPAADDILAPGDPGLAILEVPDNGIMVDYVDSTEMNAIFDANWADHAALAQPTTFVIGYHPSNFGPLYKRYITETLSYVDQFRAGNDGGPVVYATLSEMARVWTQP